MSLSSIYICENCYNEYSSFVTCCNQEVVSLTDVDYQELDFESNSYVEEDEESDQGYYC